MNSNHSTPGAGPSKRPMSSTPSFSLAHTPQPKKARPLSAAPLFSLTKPSPQNRVRDEYATPIRQLVKVEKGADGDGDTPLSRLPLFKIPRSSVVNQIGVREPPPFRIGNTNTKEDTKPLVGLTHPPLWKSEIVDVREATEEEDIGVSPRGPRGKIKWNGKGPPPLSLRLTHLQNSANSSLLLFYTSLHNTLYSRKPHHTKISPLAHVRTSSNLLIKLRSPVKGSPAHISLFWGEVPSTGQSVLVVFQTVNHECPKLGMDVRMLVEKWDDGKNVLAGIWEPFEEIEIDLSSQEEGGRTRAMLVSRYLIVEG
ncbi:hypothetical protein P7C73_g1954, partial [Tremellales sp. Uapishka_1]